MIIVKNENKLLVELSKINKSKIIGFIPTMGALHRGHTSLIDKARKKCDIVIVSVFVNPRQFNNKDDFNNYPNNLENDISLLIKHNCDLLFLPSSNDFYKKYKGIKIDLGFLNTIMEGKKRPGHFKGVVDVVYRLFYLIKPHFAYFGMKDYQQVAVVKHLVKTMNLSVQIIPCPTVREKNGLAISSRNLLLNTKEKKQSIVIYKAMRLANEWSNFYSVEEVKNKCIQMIGFAGLKVEYVSIINSDNLKHINQWENEVTICIAAYCGNIRLIDNFQITPNKPYKL